MTNEAPASASGPRFIKPGSITGHKLVFRDARVDDAEFILSLRTDAQKSRYLSSTPADVGRQVEWLERYARDPDQVYFIIEDKAGERVGTVRLYDQQGDSFCWGSWIKKDGAPSGFGIESALIIYHYALHLGFNRAHFDVRRENTSVCQFHDRFGAKIVRQSELDYFYTIDREAIDRTLQNYGKFLPGGITIAA